MTWRDGLFIHWPVDPDDVRPRVPDQLTLETREGEAWLSVIPFVLTNAGIRGTPPIARLAFPELNVRTYVRYRGDPGLYFFSIDVGSAFVATVVGRATRLPVYYARMQVSSGASGVDEVVFASTRNEGTPDLGTPTGGEPPARFSATYRPEGPVFTADEGTLEYWLSERRRFYAPRDGGTLTGEIDHDPWPLQPADVTIHENTMFAANDLPRPTAEPRAYFCDDHRMTGSILRRLRSD
ncbi:YqjF family protein [Halosolutus halophilus]|uniref:YqjF family protein n=1 Tax=Halosolutus halophilus TaxID=1552990 RepID=UPI002234FC3C|nr:DUF2071 domain-containing protein [Halosolutus halophilus]